MTKNIIPYIDIYDADGVFFCRGKMTPRKKSRFSSTKKIKRLASQGRRAALKRSEYNQDSQFGGEGHSSSWD